MAALKRSRSSDGDLPRVAHRLCVGAHAVPTVEIQVIMPDGTECVKEFVTVRHRNADLRWLQESLDLKYRSLFDHWPLLRDIEKAKDAHFGKRNQFSARNNTSGKHVPVSAVFMILVRDFELWIHTPRKDLIYVEVTVESITFLLQQTSIDIEAAPHDVDPKEPVHDKKEEDSQGYDDLAQQEIGSIIAEVIATRPGLKASWQPSRSSFMIKIDKTASKAFPAPNFKKCLRSGNASTSLASARGEIFAWVEAQTSRDAPRQ